MVKRIALGLVALVLVIQRSRMAARTRTHQSHVQSDGTASGRKSCSHRHARTATAI